MAIRYLALSAALWGIETLLFITDLDKSVTSYHSMYFAYSLSCGKSFLKDSLHSRFGDPVCLVIVFRTELGENSIIRPGNIFNRPCWTQVLGAIHWFSGEFNGEVNPKPQLKGFISCASVSANG